MTVDTVRPDELPLTFGRYTLLRLLGEGGMGRVFEAELSGPSGFRKRLALKVIAERSVGRDEQARGEFLREARIGGLLRHPNVIDCYDFGVIDDHPFIAMELVEGMSLRELIAGGPLPPTVVLDCAVQICEGLAHAHGLVVDGAPLELVHRDLKPGNMLVTQQGQVKILDFGLARASQAVAGADVAGAITATGVVRGTPSYMSPEQASGSDVDPRSDLFALGAVIFELATGDRFFDADDLLAVMMAIVDVDNRGDRVLLVDGVVPGLGGPLQRLLRSDPAMRYGRASDLALDLRSLQRRLPAGPDLRAWLLRVAEGSAHSEAGAAEDGPETVRMPQAAARPGGSMGSTRASAMAARRTNLSAEGARFVGREADVAALDEALRSGSLVTLAGTAGAGKTRLATHYGLSRLDRYVPYGGVWFCNLVEARTVAGFVHEVARALGVPLEEAGPSGGAQRLGWALAGRGRILLILDNFEQLGTDAVDVVDSWLDLAPEAAFIVTSRAPLRLSVERLLEVGPLPVEQAVRLFEARAKTVRADFSVREDELEVVEEIVVRLDGIPLAIELAAARVSVLSPSRILERLGQRFKLLAGGHRGGGARGTLRGAIDWSWDLLDPAERDALLQVSVFLGGFTLEAAEEVVDLDQHADAPWVLDVLESLRDKSLLRTWRPEGLGGEIRFGMYESIREYAREKRAKAGEGADLALRHARWAVQRGEELEWLIGGVGGGRAQAELALEIDNLLAVLQAAEAGGDHELGARSAVVAGECFRMSGSSINRRRVLERGLALSALSARCRAGLHLGMARVHSTQTDEESSMWHSTEAIDLAREAGDARLQVQAMWKFADALTGRGDLVRALEVADEALTLAESAGDPVLVGWALSSRGRTHQSQQRFGDAYEVHSRAAELFTTAGRPRAAGMELNSMAIAAVHLGRNDEAERLFARCLEGSEKNGYGIGRTRGYCNLGLLRGGLGRIEEGLAALRKALRLSQRAGDTSARVLIVIALANLSLLEGDVERSLKLNQEVAGLLESRPIPYLQSTWYRSHACALLVAGRLDEAIASSREGMRWAREDDGHPFLVSNMVVLAVILAGQDDVVGAHELFDQAEERAAQRGAGEDSEATARLVGRGLVAAMDARVALREGRTSEAAALLDRIEGPDGPLADLESRPYVEAVIRVLTGLLRLQVSQTRASCFSP